MQNLINRIRSSMQKPAEQVFRSVDMLGTGSLDIVAFERFLLMHVGSISPHEVNSLWRLLDSSGSGKVGAREFCGLFG